MSASPQPASGSPATGHRQDPPRGHPLRRRPRPGGQRGHLDRRGLVPSQRHRGRGHPQRLCPPRGIRPRPPDAGGARLHHPGPEEAPPVAEHPRHHDRHRPDQSRQGRLAPQPPDRPRADRPAADGPPGALVAGRRRAGLDRRRRHAQDRQQVQDVPGPPAARASGGSPWSTCPRRSTTTTAASTSPSATSRRSRRWPSEIRNLLADAEATRDVLHRRDHGPQGGLAGLRGRHRRRGQPGPERRGHRRRAQRPRRR